jgi:hypothetical protein
VIRFVDRLVKQPQKIETFPGNPAVNASPIVGPDFSRNQTLRFQTINQPGDPRSLLNHSLCNRQCRQPIRFCAAQNPQNVVLLSGNIKRCANCLK